MVKERQKEETKLRQREEGENKGERRGTKQMELRECVPVDEGQGRAHDQQSHIHHPAEEREGEEEKEKQQDRHTK